MIDVDRTLAATAEAVGLDDYGDPSFRDGLEQLAAAVDAEADLSDLGRAVFEATVTGALTNRLKVVDWVNRHPEIAQQPITGPLFIVGQPRTGTTALSHLLAADPANRSLLQWEGTDSVPPPTADGYADDPRFIAAREAPDVVGQLNPEFKAMHHDEPDDAVECVVVLTQHFVSAQYSPMFHVPSYDRWMCTIDQRPAYRYHRTVLQVLQSEYPGRWQLKSPHHQLGIDALLDVYPDAHLVWTHRDPVRVIGSVCSLARCLQSTFTDVDHSDEIGAHWLEYVATMADRALAARERAGDDLFFDLPYRQIVQDRLAAVRALYEHVGLPVDEGLEERFAARAAAEPQGKHGTHTYDLAEFGLTEGQVRERFAAYLARFGDLL